MTNGPSSGLTVSGSGYVSPPIVTISDPNGMGATAVAVISGGSLTGITITNPGVGYTDPTFTVSGGGGTGTITGTDLLAANASGNLTKVGSGTLTLTAVNTYSGSTAINAGTLFATQPAALPSYATLGATTIASSATLMVESDSGSGWWPTTTIDTLLTNASFAAGSTLGISVTGAAPVTYGTDIATRQVNKNFVKAGAGELILNGANSYTGTTTVTGGTLQFGDGSANSAPANTAGYVDNATLAFKVPSDLTINVPVTTTGAGNLYWPGPGVLTLMASNNNLGTGVVTVNGGTLQIGQSTTTLTAGQLIVNNAAMSQSGGTLSFTGGVDGDVQIGGAAGTTGSYTMSGGA